MSQGVEDCPVLSVEQRDSTATGGALTPTEIATLIAVVQGVLPATRAETLRLSQLPTRGLVADETLKFDALGTGGARRAFVLVSGALNTGGVRHGAECASTLRELLPSPHRDAVVAPLAHGGFGARNYAVYPWHAPCPDGMLGRVHRRFSRGHVLAFLRALCELNTGSADEARPACRESLALLVRDPVLSPAVQAAAQHALRRLDEGAWRPRHCPDHNDLWPGNFVSPRDGSGRRTTPQPILIVDWAGATLRGYGLSDLFRIASALGLSHRALRREAEQHCHALGVEAADAPGHVLATLGHIRATSVCLSTEVFQRIVAKQWRNLVEVGLASVREVPGVVVREPALRAAPALGGR
jgi:hypothetical protein